MKQCTKCGKKKPLTEFHKHAPSADGYKPRCKACQCEAERRARRDPHRKAVQTWHDIRKRIQHQSEYRGVRVRITKEAFVSWAEIEFAKWFKDNPDVRPSVDRIEASGHYELGNIRVIALSENSRRSLSNKNVHAKPGLAWCGRCRRYKQRTEFGVKRSAPHGLQGYCKACRRDYAARNNGKNSA